MTLIIAIGNTLRRDDGAAHRVVELLGAGAGARILSCHQLMPELAEDIAAAREVVFVDADVEPGEPRLEPLVEPTGWSALGGHSIRPAEVLALASRLYGFRGEAWVCRVPGEDFGEGTGLSPVAESNAQQAVKLLKQHLARQA
ncbi:MAG: hydrogenase maturation protease [Bryobacteraceae bacterium]